MNNSTQVIDEHRQYIDELRRMLAERDARIAELEAAQRWVSVDERLPDDSRWVWVHTPDYYGKAYYAYHRCSWVDVLHTLINGVTHWMPLPPAPVTDVTL